MNKINQKVLSVSFALLSFLLLSSPVFADDEVRKLAIDSKIKGFTQEIWQDNFESDKMILGPNDKFQYQIKVKNDGNRNQTWIEVNSILPSTITTSEPMSFKIPQLAPNQEYVQTFTVYLKDKKELNKAITKNTVHTSIKAESGSTDADDSYFYSNNGTKNIATSTSSAQTLPASGMPILLSTLLGSSLVGFGLFARKFARGY